VVKKLNESYYYIEESAEIIYSIKKQLTIVDESARFKPQFKKYGMDLPTFKFYRDFQDGIVVPSGLIHFLENFGIYPIQEEPEFSNLEIVKYLEDCKEILPFEPYQYQIELVMDSLKNKQQMGRAATGSGKSVIITLVSNFLVQKGKKVLIIVPSISLVTQIKSDILDYNFKELHDQIHLIGGEFQEKNLNSNITISTWQSLHRMDKKALEQVDAIIIDEAHGMKMDSKLLELALAAKNAKYRLAVTGTLPELPQDKMSIFSIVGKPKTYIRTSGLIKMGLATPLVINTLKLSYNSYECAQFKGIKSYPEQLSFIKEHDNRNLFIAKLALGVAQKTGNTVIMYSHVQHGKDIFIALMKQRYPEVEVQNSNIVGKKAFEFQEKYRIYFINGSTEAKQREEIRRILDIPTRVKITLEDDTEVFFLDTDNIELIDGSFKQASYLSQDDEISEAFLSLYLSKV